MAETVCNILSFKPFFREPLNKVDHASMEPPTRQDRQFVGRPVGDVPCRQDIKNSDEWGSNTVVFLVLAAHCRSHPCSDSRHVLVEYPCPAGLQDRAGTADGGGLGEASVIRLVCEP
jgi:hypothetical protein